MTFCSLHVCLSQDFVAIVWLLVMSCFHQVQNKLLWGTLAVLCWRLWIWRGCIIFQDKFLIDKRQNNRPSFLPVIVNWLKPLAFPRSSKQAALLVSATGNPNDNTAVTAVTILVYPRSHSQATGWTQQIIGGMALSPPRLTMASEYKQEETRQPNYCGKYRLKTHTCKRLMLRQKETLNVQRNPPLTV